MVVGESVAGATTVRRLRALGHTGPLTLVGAEPGGGPNRPPLSKHVLDGAQHDDTLGHALDGLDIELVRVAATGLDPAARTLCLADGRALAYDALVLATGAEPRRLAGPGQRGELVLRTLPDAQALRARLDTARSALVVGSGVLGMEVASACARRGVPVTVVDRQPPLERVLGGYLSGLLTARAEAAGIEVLVVDGDVALVGDPVSGLRLPDGTVLSADVVVTCAGDTPCTNWLAGTELAGPHGVHVDEQCRTAVPGIWAVGDVACLDTPCSGRTPFWSQAVAMAGVAAASVLGLPPSGPPTDDYFWTSVAGTSVKAVGPLPVHGPPDDVEGDPDTGNALLTWRHDGGPDTVVAHGRPITAGRLRARSRAGARSSVPAPA